ICIKPQMRISPKTPGQTSWHDGKPGAKQRACAKLKKFSGIQEPSTQRRIYALSSAVRESNRKNG
ncbi:hypothetical protein, partial [Mesorhizobium sp. M7A.F.Ca.US.005.03.1.1]|uniref:hypothetical protein n=1 Tax=Mesorhizobium sp. M7A.F.Ca.US.005.03.1.1 TaxID=2496736 RepID=UPI0019D11FEF